MIIIHQRYLTSNFKITGYQLYYNNLEMSDTVIKIENLSKLYQLGEIGTGTISHDLNRWVAKLRGKEDPFAKVGHVNDRTQKAEKDETVWALKDINLEVKQGEVLGIIGKNGAGKSTLLKILSRVTSPSTGSIKVKGRLASLLEVGTGFHPEMTGRENIYMNGTIMGMRKWEIDSKFDEIVDFAGVAKYIDTPVKRYSSGMTVRLGFAIAAHLEPEILVVDEVLAVGDAEFQQKAIGKMQEVSQGQGRTVLFVSHNMVSIQELCQTAIVLHQGKVIKHCNVNDAVNFYRDSMVQTHSKYVKDCSGFNKSKVSEIRILDENNVECNSIDFGQTFKIAVKIAIKEELRNPVISARISNSSNINIVTFRSNDYKDSPLGRFLKPGNYEVHIKIRDLNLLNDNYQISVSLLDGKEMLDVLLNIISFEVLSKQLRQDLIYITKQLSTNSIIFHEPSWQIIT